MIKSNKDEGWLSAECSQPLRVSESRCWWFEILNASDSYGWLFSQLWVKRVTLFFDAYVNFHYLVLALPELKSKLFLPQIGW